MDEVKKEKAYAKAQVYKWADVFTEKVGIEELVKIKKIVVKTGNIAGVDIPVFDKMVFKEKEYDLIKMPLWVDYGIEEMKTVMTLNARTVVLEKQDEFIKEELRITTQRVNLFEKIKIPEAKESIKKIQIYLGDMQTAAVVTGKIAKAKIEKKLTAQGQS